MANMFDRTATAEDDDLDARARSLDSGPTKRDRPSSEGKPSALDRARGRGYAPPDDSMDRAKRDLGTKDNSTAAQPPSEVITPTPPSRYDPTGGAAAAAASSAGPGKRPNPSMPARTPPTPSEPSPPFKVPDNYDPTGQREAAKVQHPLGSGIPPIPPGDYKWPKWDDRPNWLRYEPKQPGIVPHQDEANFVPGPAPEAAPPTPDEPKPVTSDDEASFRPGPLPKPGVTPPGKGGGGGGAPGRRKALGDPTRREAYDPIADRADPRNVAIVDDQGRVNPKLAEKGAIDPTAPGVKTGEAAARYTNNYTNSLAGATSYMENMFHQKKGDPNHAEGYQAMTMGAVGAPDQQTVNGVFKVIDPNNELAPKEKMELATRAMHDWYTSRGDSKSADKVAAEMLQYGNKQAQGYGKQVMMALKNGDRQGAVDGIQKAYDWLPDGYHAEVKNNALTITETATGKTINQLPLDDKQIRNLGLGLASGTLYWDIVGQRAGKPGTFTPPAPQPTQAVATTPPGAAGPSGTPSPAGPASPQAPAAAAPPPSATAPAPPGATPAPPGATPPVVQPPVPAPPSPPPQVTPSSNRPAAPAPAVPGPGPTQQAAPPPVKPDPGVPMAPPPAPPPPPTQGDGGPPGSPAGQPAINAKVPPPLQGPVQPSTSKRPIVEGEPPTAGTKTPEVKTDEKTPPPPKKGEVVQDKDDPDTVPTVNGKPRVVRRSTYEPTQDVQAARQEIAKADAEYQKQQDWLARKQKTTKGTDVYERTLMQLRNDIETTHRDKIARAQSVVSEFNKQSTARDAQERADLKYVPLKGQDKVTEEAKVDAKLEGYVKDDGKSLKPYAYNALRLYPTKQKWTDIRESVLALKALNPKISTEKLTDHVLTMITHLGSSDEDKAQTVNNGAKEKASRFVVVGEDIARNPVIGMGDKKNRVYLHVPADTLTDIKRLKDESYQAHKKALKAKHDEWVKAKENDKLREQAYARVDPHGTKQKSIAKWGGTAGDEPPLEP